MYIKEPQRRISLFFIYLCPTRLGNNPCFHGRAQCRDTLSYSIQCQVGSNNLLKALKHMHNTFVL